MSVNAETTTGREHLFKTGQSGNPKGRPKGSRNKATQAALELLSGEMECVTRKVVEEALKGNMAACKLILDKLVPASKERTVKLDLPDISLPAGLPVASQFIIQAVCNGEVTPGEGEAVARILESHRKNIETQELAARIATLEESMQRHASKK